MSYYKEKRKANLEIYKRIKALKESKQSGSISSMVLEITNLFEVSDKAVKERLQLLELNEPSMFLDGDEIKWQ